MREKLFTILAIIFFLITPTAVYAYIDPGTTGSLFNAVSSIMPMILAFLGFLFLPLKRFIKFIKKKLKGDKEKSAKG